MHQDVLYERPLSLAAAIINGTRILKEFKMPHSAWPQIAEHSLFVKDRLLQEAGMNERNDYRLSWPVSIDVNSDMMRPVKALASLIARAAGGELVNDSLELANVKGNQVKITKLMGKPDNICRPNNFYGGEMAVICQMLNIPEHQTLSSNYHNSHQRKHDKTAADELIHKIQVQYGNLINTERSLVLSGNPYDLLTLSQDSGYKSCVSFKGGSFATIADYLESPNVLVAYIEMPKKKATKIGRKLVYVGLEPMGIWVGRQYGTWSNNVQSVLEENLFKLFPWVKAEELMKKGGLNQFTVNIHGASYLDYSYGELYMGEPLHQMLHADWNGAMNDGRSIMFEHLRPFVIPRGKCLSCGSAEYADMGNNVCSKCKQLGCQSCFSIDITREYVWNGKTVRYCKECLTPPNGGPCAICKDTFNMQHLRPLGGKDANTEDGSPAFVCRTCQGKKQSFSCNVCGKVHFIETGEEYRNTSTHGAVCIACFKQFRECAWCHATQHESAFSSPDAPICGGCEERTFVCKRCGERHERESASVFPDVCYECARSYPRCKACGYRYDDNDKLSKSPIESICAGCFRSFPVCTKCGDRVTPSEYKKHKGKCPKCRPKTKVIAKEDVADRPAAVQNPIDA